MLSFANILVPTAFDEPSEHALDVAVEFAREFGSKVTLVHAYFIPPMPYGGPFAWVMDELRIPAQAALTARVEKLRAVYPNCAGLLHGGAPDDRILAAIQETDADLLVLGTHARHGAARWLLGSLAEHLVQRSPVPVLVVPQRGPHAHPQGVVRCLAQAMLAGS